MIPTSVIEELLSYSEDSRIALDSRKVSAGDVFVAIKGDIADGNDFVEDALSAGATRVFSNRPCADPRVITVHDTVELLMEAAKEVMSRSHLKSRIAITGSNGKT
ncbi:MAG: Mur ligase domain-containing protein, partial [Mesotoga sp.]|nr:Mur ligase domain-containing protein [Mesotoga sp.]